MKNKTEEQREFYRTSLCLWDDSFDILACSANENALKSILNIGYSYRHGIEPAMVILSRNIPSNVLI